MYSDHRRRQSRCGGKGSSRTWDGVGRSGEVADDGWLLLFDLLEVGTRDDVGDGVLQEISDVGADCFHASLTPELLLEMLAVHHELQRRILGDVESRGDLAFDITVHFSEQYFARFVLLQQIGVGFLEDGSQDLTATLASERVAREPSPSPKAAPVGVEVDEDELMLGCQLIVVLTRHLHHLTSECRSHDAGPLQQEPVGQRTEDCLRSHLQLSIKAVERETGSA